MSPSIAALDLPVYHGILLLATLTAATIDIQCFRLGVTRTVSDIHDNIITCQCTWIVLYHQTPYDVYCLYKVYFMERYRFGKKTKTFLY